MSNILDCIEAKRLGRELDGVALSDLVRGYTSGDIPDYQMSAWLMAVTINGMSLDETCAFTAAMLRSGDSLNLSKMPGPTIDKHSSGGVGDKTTLALVPMLAASGAYMAKMSGHGLGLTGGTLDKLESVPGIRTELSIPEVLRQVSEIGACICAQSESLVPADRSIYALRDITGTVASIPLIAASIMSKKLASGADAILLDIKVGSGALMPDIDSARELARTCLAIGEKYGKRMTAVLSDMNQPLGRAVGNSIELIEAMALLHPDADCAQRRFAALTHALYAEAGRLIGWEVTTGGEGVLTSGDAGDRLNAIIDHQGGDLRAFMPMIDVENLDSSIARLWSDGIVTAERAGVIRNIDAGQVAKCAAMLGTGRARKGDGIDCDAGIWLLKTVGDVVEEGEAIAYLHSSDPERLRNGARAAFQGACVLGDEWADDEPVVIEVLRGDAVGAAPTFGDDSDR